MATGGNDPFSTSNTRNLLQHVFSPKIVSSPTGYVPKVDMINIDNVYVTGAVNNTTGVVGSFPPGSVSNYTYTATFNGSANFFEFDISSQLTRGRYLVTILPAPTATYQELSMNTTIFYNGSDTVTGGATMYIDSLNYLTLRTKTGAKSTFLTITNIRSPSPTALNPIVLYINFWKVS